MLFLLLSFTLASQATAAAPAPPQPSQVAAPAEKQTPAQPRGTLADYIVGPQDKLRIVVFDEPGLSNTIQIGTDGTFDFPYIQRVVAAGKTLSQLEEELEKRLADGYIKNAQITIEVEQFRSRSVFIAGEVRTSSRVALTTQMTLLEALVQAGWVTPNAGSQVTVTRGAGPTGDQPASGAPLRILKINLSDVQAGLPEANIVLREGDSIFVPKAERFFVVGLVKTPGAYTHEPGMTVQQALALAGGISEKGSNRGIKIKRKVDGKDVEVGVGLNDTVQAGDTIVIRQRLL